jgi:hypothetical protein
LQLPTGVGFTPTTEPCARHDKESEDPMQSRTESVNAPTDTRIVRDDHASNPPPRTNPRARLDEAMAVYGRPTR